MVNQQQEDHTRHVFDSFCRIVLLNEARDYYTEVQRRSRNVILLEDCAEVPHTEDRYFQAECSLRVLCYDVDVSNPDIVAALEGLTEEKRTIVLLAYCLEMPDREISAHLGIVRRTVAYKRQRALHELRRLLHG